MPVTRRPSPLKTEQAASSPWCYDQGNDDLVNTNGKPLNVFEITAALSDGPINMSEAPASTLQEMGAVKLCKQGQVQSGMNTIHDFSKRSGAKFTP